MFCDKKNLEKVKSYIFEKEPKRLTRNTADGAVDAICKFLTQFGTNAAVFSLTQSSLFFHFDVAFKP